MDELGRFLRTAEAVVNPPVVETNVVTVTNVITVTNEVTNPSNSEPPLDFVTWGLVGLAFCGSLLFAFWIAKRT